jgi:hypothetical protein
MLRLENTFVRCLQVLGHRAGTTVQDAKAGKKNEKCTAQEAKQFKIAWVNSKKAIASKRYMKDHLTDHSRQSQILQEAGFHVPLLQMECSTDLFAIVCVKFYLNLSFFTSLAIKKP